MGRGYEVIKLPDLQTFHVRYTQPLREDIENAQREIAEEIVRELDASSERWYRINDLTDIDSGPIFSLVVRAMPLEVRGDPGTSTDPRISTLFVGQGPSVQILIDGLKQGQYGGWLPKLFPTLDTALDYIRNRLAAGDGVEAQSRQQA